jgi:hypothetical protein
MRIMKLFMPIVMLTFTLFVSGTAAAQTTHFFFDGGIGGIVNPCNGSSVTVLGPNTINYEQNSTADGAMHVTVHIRFDGSGQDTAGNPFAASFNGGGQFDSAVSSYDFPFHSMWVGQGNAPTFAMDGVVRVYVKDGSGIGAGIVQFQTSCQANVGSA